MKKIDEFAMKYAEKYFQKGCSREIEAQEDYIEGFSKAIELIEGAENYYTNEFGEKISNEKLASWLKTFLKEEKKEEEKA